MRMMSGQHYAPHIGVLYRDTPTYGQVEIGGKTNQFQQINIPLYIGVLGRDMRGRPPDIGVDCHYEHSRW
jgi:hypothetical protein